MPSRTRFAFAEESSAGPLGFGSWKQLQRVLEIPPPGGVRWVRLSVLGGLPNLGLLWRGGFQSRSPQGRLDDLHRVDVEVGNQKLLGISSGHRPQVRPLGQAQILGEGAGRLETLDHLAGEISDLPGVIFDAWGAEPAKAL